MCSMMLRQTWESFPSLNKMHLRKQSLCCQALIESNLHSLLSYRLPGQCQYLGLPVADYFKQWINLKKVLLCKLPWSLSPCLPPSLVLHFSSLRRCLITTAVLHWNELFSQKLGWASPPAPYCISSNRVLLYLMGCVLQLGRIPLWQAQCNVCIILGHCETLFQWRFCCHQYCWLCFVLQPYRAPRSMVPVRWNSS